jgi:hypothetical protein
MLLVSSACFLPIKRNDKKGPTGSNMGCVCSPLDFTHCSSSSANTFCGRNTTCAGNTRHTEPCQWRQWECLKCSILTSHWHGWSFKMSPPHTVTVKASNQMTFTPYLLRLVPWASSACGWPRGIPKRPPNPSTSPKPTGGIEAAEESSIFNWKNKKYHLH